MTLSAAAQKDLHKLATARVGAALDSVAQLLDDDEQLLHLALTVLSSIAKTAAMHIHQTVVKPDGSHPSPGEAMCQILATLAAAHGIEATALSEDEAKRAGFVKD